MLIKFLDYVKSFALDRVFMTAIELDIFRQAEQAPLSQADLKQRLDIADTPIADVFLDVLVAFQILAEENGKLTLLPWGRSVLPVYESIQSWNNVLSDIPDGAIACDASQNSAGNLPQITIRN